MSLEVEIQTELKKHGVDFIYYVDISKLPEQQNNGFPNAILFGIALSQKFLQKVANTPDYVQKMIQNNEISEDEFHQKEIKTDSLADFIANYLEKRGYSALSQSENNLYLKGVYDLKTKTTPLPHKTIALRAGLGWIGKNNLLVTNEFGSAISICTVLTNAPLKTVFYTHTDSLCGSCTICKNICSVKALKGETWNFNTSRDEIIDVYKCNTCIKCTVLCPYTQKYVKETD